MNGPNVTLDARALSVDEFIKHALGPHVDRPVINQTGITGLFDFHLEYAPDETTPDFHDRAAGADSELAGPSIFAALRQQLGLRLEPAKGLANFLVINQVAKPSAN